MMLYFMIIDGKQTGPYPKENLLTAGLRPETPVWCQGMDDWRQAMDVADLADLFYQDSAFGAYTQTEIPPQQPQQSFGNASQQYSSRPPFGPQFPNSYSDRYNQNPYPARQHYNWMTWAIIATVAGFLFSCVGLIFGIVALTSASKANTAYAAGNEIEGASSNATAKTMTIIALVLAGLGLLFIFSYWLWALFVFF